MFSQDDSDDDEGCAGTGARVQDPRMRQRKYLKPAE